MKNSKYLIFMGMGIELVGLVISSLYLGKWIDEKYNLKGLGMVLFSMCALAGWIYHIVLLTKKLDREKSEQ